jgi:hypothetical protein
MKTTQKSIGGYFSLLLCWLFIQIGQADLFAFNIGDHVETTATVNVRQTAAGTSLGTQSSGIIGVIIAGPTTATLNGTSYTWWDINFPSSPNGWVASVGLESAPPTVSTLAATSITTSSAQMNASVNPNSASTTAYFQYGTTTSYGNNSGSLSGITTSENIYSSWTGLSPNTTYHYRVVAYNSTGTSYGGDASFTTAPLPPTAQTTAATSITTTTAQLNGNINGNGVWGTVYWQYGTTTSYGYTTPSGDMGPTAGSGGYAVSSLSPNTLYHFRVVAVSSGGTTYGSDMTFTTAVQPAPTAQTTAATSITTTTAQLNGNINGNGVWGTVYWQYGTTTGYGYTTPSGDMGPTAGSGSYGVSSLSPNTLYHFRVVAVSSGGTTYGSDLTFTTSTPPGPIIQTLAASLIGVNSAQLNASLNPNGFNTTAYFQYGTSASYGNTTLSGNFGTTSQNIGFALNSLTANTVYHYRIVAYNSAGTSYGGDTTFQTLALNQPDLIIQNVTFSPSSVTAGNSFTVNFRVRNNGTAACVSTLARLRITTDTTLTLADPPLSPLDVSIPAIAAGSYYDFSGTITIPVTTPQGLYYVGVFADADNRAGQSNVTNDGGISGSQVTVAGNGASLPAILTQPQNKNVTQGATATFSVTAGGIGPFSYQWKREGRSIYGQTSSQLVLNNVSTVQAGNYAVDVANAAGTVTSSNALLTVSASTNISSQPISGVCTIYGTIDTSLPTVVITHGWQPGETAALPSWVTDMSLAISNRCVLAGLPANASGQRVNIIRYYWQEAFTINLLTATDYTLNHGFTLASQLKSILGNSYANKIHFIGHSLGTVVNTYAVYLLRDWNVEQFTILDAPFAAPSIDPWLFYRYLPSDRVKWVDNYYGTSIIFPAAAGSPIDGAAPSGGLSLNANHPGVHDFYYSTITNVSSTQGYFYSCLLPNFDTRPAPQRWTPPPAPLYQGLIGVLDDWAELLWYGAETVGGATMQVVNYQIDSQLRGAIMLTKPATTSLLVSKAGATPSGTDGPVPNGGTGIAEVSAAIDLVIPPDAKYMTFKFLCTQAGQGDWLTAKFNDNLLMSFRADNFTGTNFQTATLPVDAYAGQAGQLVVKLNCGGTNASEFVVADFSFLTTTAPTLAKPGVINGAFQFDLHGLIGSNYVVQVSSNLINWSSMSTSSIPTEGSISITNPVSGQPKQFYRAVMP